MSQFNCRAEGKCLKPLPLGLNPKVNPYSGSFNKWKYGDQRRTISNEPIQLQGEMGTSQTFTTRFDPQSWIIVRKFELVKIWGSQKDHKYWTNSIARWNGNVSNLYHYVWTPKLNHSQVVSISENMGIKVGP